MVMIKENITQTTDYEPLIDLFIRNELEFSEEEPVPTDLIKCWKATRKEGGEETLVGGIALAKRQGEYIIDGIAVEPQYRKSEIGKALLAQAVEEVRKRDGRKIYLVARAPGFFRKFGFISISKEEAPNFFECMTCDQYGIKCHPEVMEYSMK